MNEKEWQPSVNPWLIATGVMLATFMVVLDTSVANVALLQMAGSFSSSSDEVIWVLTSYLVANGIVLPSTAWFSSFFGRKRFLIICIVIFTFASALCGISTSLGMMIFARILQGLGGGALMPISQAVLLESFPHEKRGVAMSIFGLGIIVAPIIGPTLGGWITDNYSWHWIFYINVPVGILSIILSEMFIEDPPYARKSIPKSIDYIGFLALIIWLVTLQIILDKGQRADWFESSWICWLAIISVSAMIFFIIWEISFKDSIIDLKVFTDRNFAIGTVLSTFVGAVLYGTLAMLPLFLQNLMKYPAVQSGIAITPRGIGSFFTILLAGFLSNKIDTRIQIAFGFVLLGISNYMLGNINLSISMDNIILPNVLSGFALGFIFIPLTTATFGTLKNKQITNATGIFGLMRSIGGGIGVSIVGMLLSRNTQIHQTYLASHLNPGNLFFQQKLDMAKHFLSMNMDMVTATHKAQAIIYGMLVKNATLQSFIDIFKLYGLICLILVPTAFIFKKAVLSNKTSDNAAAH
ncbi:MAG: DHA2 family efflux MFS transporter permease subunit [bacterium]